eukprot:636788_1
MAHSVLSFFHFFVIITIDLAQLEAISDFSLSIASKMFAVHHRNKQLTNETTMDNLGTIFALDGSSTIRKMYKDLFDAVDPNIMSVTDIIRKFRHLKGVPSLHERIEIYQLMHQYYSEFNDTNMIRGGFAYHDTSKHFLVHFLSVKVRAQQWKLPQPSDSWFVVMLFVGNGKFMSASINSLTTWGHASLIVSDFSDIRNIARMIMIKDEILNYNYHSYSINFTLLGI